MNKSKIFIPLLLLGIAFWGISFPLSKDAFDSIHPYTFIFYRFLISAIVLSLLFYKSLFKMNKQVTKRGLISGFLLFMGIAWQTAGLDHTSASNASFIAGVEVVLIPFFAYFFLGRSIQPKVWIACLLALFGLYTIAMSSGFSNFRVGDLYVFVGSLFYSAYVLYVSKVSTKRESGESALPFVIVQLFTCAIMGGLLSLTVSDAPSIFELSSPGLWKVLIFVGVFATAYMYCVQNIAQKHIEPEKIALAYLLEPIFATVFAYILLNENITTRTLIGGSFILLAMLISEINLSGVFRKMKELYER